MTTEEKDLIETVIACYENQDCKNVECKFRGKPFCKTKMERAMTLFLKQLINKPDIKVGSEMGCYDEFDKLIGKFIVTYVNGSNLCGIGPNGGTYAFGLDELEEERVAPTGRHVDVMAFLKALTSEE